MPKLRVRFSKSGLVTFFGSTFLTANGAAATFFPTFFFGFTYIRKSHKKKIKIDSIFHQYFVDENRSK